MCGQAIGLGEQLGHAGLGNVWLPSAQPLTINGLTLPTLVLTSAELSSPSATGNVHMTRREACDVAGLICKRLRAASSWGWVRFGSLRLNAELDVDSARFVICHHTSSQSVYNPCVRVMSGIAQQPIL
eukprot:4281673-Amphidinium_carterae.1